MARLLASLGSLAGGARRRAGADASAKAADRAARARKLVAEGVSQRRAGKTHAALATLERAHALYPQERLTPIWLMVEEAATLLGLGRSQTAIERLEAFMEAKGKRFPKALRLYGLALAELQETARAVAAFEEMLATPGFQPGPEDHLHLASFHERDGRFEAARRALAEAAARFPDDPRIPGRIHALNLSFGVFEPQPAPALSPVPRSSVPPAATGPAPVGSPVGSPVEADPAVAHLFTDVRAAHGRGVAGLTLHLQRPPNQHVAALLDFADQVTPFARHDDPAPIDAFFVWGVTAAESHNLCRRHAAAWGKPLLTLEYGFVSSLDIALQGSAQHSLIVCPGPIYFDSAQATAPETLLNDPAFRLTEAQTRRARAAIDRLVETRVTKYNHAPAPDIAARLDDAARARGALGPDGRPRKRILLVDQRLGDKSVSMGLAGGAAFRRMFEQALAMEDHDIVVKLHPDAISGGKGSYLKPLVEEYACDRVTVIDYELNPFRLFEAVDEVFVVVSQLGFEAAFAGKRTWCFGVPFYAGWGVTRDQVATPRRRARRSLEEIFHVFYIRYSRYWVPGSARCELEDLIDYIVDNRAPPPAPPRIPALDHGPGANTVPTATAAPGLAAGPVQGPKILMILPSERHGASGRYMQTLGESLERLGCRVMIMAEGRVRPVENAVRWTTMSFEGALLSPATVARATAFDPDVIYMNGVRTRAQRAALEMMARCRAILATQSEDDDVDIYAHYRAGADLDHLTALDRPVIDEAALAAFLAGNDWLHTARVLRDPHYDRWVEPVLRMTTNRLARLHTAIWRPFADRLAEEYGRPPLVVPPVVRAADFAQTGFPPDERAAILRRHGLDPASLVFFLGGSVYAYSNDFQVFLRALNVLAARSDRRLSLIVAGKFNLPVDDIVARTLAPGIERRIFHAPPDPVFLELTRLGDVSCSPGGISRFERYRLPSRLVKAMAMGKPVVVGECGFGESLTHGADAVVTEGATPEAWAERLGLLLDDDRRAEIGRGAQAFARAHFDADAVAAQLRDAFVAALKAPGAGGFGAALRPPADRRRDLDAPAQTGASTAPGLAALMARGMQSLASVVHVGAGAGTELPDYIRLGAGDIVLVEPQAGCAARLAGLEDGRGRIRVLAVAATDQAGPGEAPLILLDQGGEAACPGDARPKTGDSANGGSGAACASLLAPQEIREVYPGLRPAGEAPAALLPIGAVLAEGGPARGVAGPALLAIEAGGMEARLLAALPDAALAAYAWILVAVSTRPLHAGGPTRDAVAARLAQAGFATEDVTLRGDDGVHFLVGSRESLPGAAAS